MTRSEVQYDHKSQLKRIEEYLVAGEQLYAVFDCKGGGSGFVGITSNRLIFYDQGIVLPKKTMISLPYSRITAIASSDEGTLLRSSEITLITPAGNFVFAFWGAEKAHTAYRLISQHVLGL